MLSHVTTLNLGTLKSLHRQEQKPNLYYPTHTPACSKINIADFIKSHEPMTH